MKINNPNIHKYMRYFGGSWNFGEHSNDEDEDFDDDDEEGDLVDIIEKNGHIFLKSKKY
ncbi:hypothetical protein MMC28_004791, partial [Mycoblastus sanguinarius]|nr:hypothetical protein [Mycoblastus sanguinarius]